MQALKKLLGIDHPIVQAPMLGVSTPAMAAAASNAGALGSLAVGGISPDRARELIRATKALTDRPFALNLFAHQPAVSIRKKDIDVMQDFLADVCKRYDIPFEQQDPDTFHFYYYEDQLQVILDENIPIVSFTFGLLNAATVAALKKRNIVLIGTATSVAEAKMLDRSGVDAIAVQGIEAGGHRGTFLSDGPMPQVGLYSLLPQVREAVTLPLLAAGGIYDATTMKAAFALGASAVQIGSLFITADESSAAECYKESVLNAVDTSTVLTRAFSGRWARGIQNEFMRLMDAKGITIPDYTFQNQLMSSIRAHAAKHNNKEFIAMWAGQSSGKSVRGSTREIVERLVKGVGW